ncbi:phosphate ABC transporter permease subunit PstC [Notoacmeibacter ruber]|uniref:Phosphate transport system permease protein n=1 Tax=Notoacmeibacter ruber TaxID=2670375 RepID=A0A3L7JC65_9HYPH|nr:phosphate ABC transporter permease subunit PstC [Notoacmeibacter ruber]RLQ88236.1 phosphate ABC transporter permease subunit PstC [Notoacmeibacter ruber]
MSFGTLFLAIAAIAAIAFFVSRQKVLRLADGDRRRMHSLPHYHGMHALLFAVVPAFFVLLAWSALQPVVVDRMAASHLSGEQYDTSGERSLAMSEVRRVADAIGTVIASDQISVGEVDRLDREDLGRRLESTDIPVLSNVPPQILESARLHYSASSTGHLLEAGLVILLALAGAVYGFMATNPDLRARNRTEMGVRGLLVAAACVAIFTTFGIVLSLLFNTIEFFSIYPADEFFFSLIWSPSFGGGSELGILPLLWGTLYISFIALLVSVPLGLFSAVYLAEYAHPKFRSLAKPLLEVLTGIPTIVYGLFALLIVGPALSSVFGRGGLGWMPSDTAVITAGLVMGIMLIPFVSSLSDDVINAVPQAMRDGSYGLGATKSETVRKVILPAALPGIVGAILLAASRAIGETMIVVLGAGAAARMSLNPFEAMTTVTAKIVSQLTGDADFASPEALVAFALGMTLFVVTLGLNIVALAIVRRYREQYE